MGEFGCSHAVKCRLPSGRAEQGERSRCNNRSHCHALRQASRRHSAPPIPGLCMAATRRPTQVHDPDAATSSATRARSSASPNGSRSEEHTSELQSLMRISYAVFCLKKKKNNTQNYYTHEY